MCPQATARAAPVASSEGLRMSAVNSSQPQSIDASRPGAQPSWAGKHIARFKLIGELGRGGMGRVFRAQDITLNRQVALKVLPARTKDGRRSRKIEQLIREARAAASLEHPNIVTIYEVGESGGVYYIAM